MQLPLSYYDILDKTNKYVFIISINFRLNRRHPDLNRNQNKSESPPSPKKKINSSL